ncbi:ankyrin repeat domain-containing protein 61-like isoform X2 [Periophthalmus magnuspinnatus]|uniref:ankyrin repeat domain-containing protein 61-like isoform X2 n=1 Tax=Periophthalmus magnuspinnatus TaxID=409849 RepID=UPI0024372024|nr:ankyrin repeat domain-containing protein 61-like isoform X2 [Periophthalmus magnuspinnatus]
MDEDTEGTDELSLTHGSNTLIEIYHVTPRKVFWKALSTYPLHLAAMNRKLESMKSLLAMGADIEKRDKQGRTSLHLVIMSWPSLQSSTKKSSNSSPFQAILMRVCEKVEACLQLLCEHGADINAEVTGVNKETALHIAVSYSALPAVKTLIRYGANVNVMDSAGMTPLHRAAGILNKDILLHLIKHGADVNMAMIQSGNTPLHIAVNVWATMMAKPKVDNLECITELLKNGADPNKCNFQDRTALQEACFMECTELVDLFLSYGGDINKLNKDGENCLFMFLNRGVKVTNNELLSKLFGLTTPLIFQNKNGHLPSSLMLPCSSRFKEPILRLSQEPRSLKSICKAFIYLHHNHNRTKWQQLLPAVLYEFVFNEWDSLDGLLLDVEMNNNRASS